jgi:hypothetical protein
MVAHRCFPLIFNRVERGYREEPREPQGSCVRCNDDRLSRTTRSRANARCTLRVFKLPKNSLKSSEVVFVKWMESRDILGGLNDSSLRNSSFCNWVSRFRNGSNVWEQLGEQDTNRRSLSLHARFYSDLHFWHKRTGRKYLGYRLIVQ